MLDFVSPEFAALTFSLHVTKHREDKNRLKYGQRNETSFKHENNKATSFRLLFLFIYFFFLLSFPFSSLYFSISFRTRYSLSLYFFLSFFSLSKRGKRINLDRNPIGTSVVRLSLSYRFKFQPLFHYTFSLVKVTTNLYLYFLLSSFFFFFVSSILR